MAGRRAEFLVVSETVTADELLRRLGPADQLVAVGEPDGIRRRPARDNAWSVIATGGSDAAIDDLLERVLERVRPLRPELTMLAGEGATLILRLVAYFDRHDAVGQGFGLSAADLVFLGDIGAFLDADLYAS